MKTLRSLEVRVSALAARVPTREPGVCVVFHSAVDDSLAPQDVERLRIARTTGAAILRIHWGKPTAGAVPS